MQIVDTINVMKARVPRNRIVQLILLSALMHFGPPLTAQYGPAQLPATEALASSVTARIETAADGASNPAAVDMSAGPSIQVASTPSPLGLDGVVESALTAGVPLGKKLRLGMAVMASGESRYLESALAASLAWKPTDRFTAGARVRFLALAVDGYPFRTAPSADIGALVELDDRSRFGLAVIGLLRPTLAGRARAPTVAIGVARELDSSSTLSIDLHQELGREPSIAVGLSFVPITDWVLRAGIGSEPFRLATGAGFQFDTTTISFASVYIADIGLRHSIGAGFDW
jgi:hypothetical protein